MKKRTILLTLVACAVALAQTAGQPASDQRALVVDRQGAVYLGGAASATLVKLDSTGAQLWRTTLSTDPQAKVLAIAQSSDGTLFAAGSQNNGRGFLAHISATGEALATNALPAVAGALAIDSQGSIYLGGDGFLLKLSADFSVVSQLKTAVITGLAVDQQGAVYAAVAGSDGRARVSKLSSDASGWWWQLDLGPGTPAAVAVDSFGFIYVTGATSSLDFVTRQAAGNSRLDGEQDAFAAKLQADGELLWSTYLGGRGTDAGTSLAFDAAGNVMVGGYTTSSDFPGADAAFGWNGGEDGFVAWLNSGTGQVLTSAYVGSAGQDRIAAIAADLQGGLYLAGSSSDGTEAQMFRHLSTVPELAASAKTGASPRAVSTLVPAVCSANLTVTDLTDSLTAPAANSLRDAVNNACDGATITITATGTIRLAGRILLNKNLTIFGPGATSLTISGFNRTRIFFVGTGTLAAFSGTVNLSEMTLANGFVKGGGSTAGGAGAGMGGAIFHNGGTLNVTNVSFSSNQAIGGDAIPSAGYGGGGFAGNATGTDGADGGDLGGVGGTGGDTCNPCAFGDGGAGAGGGGGFFGNGGNGGFGGGGGAGRGFIGGTGGFGGGGGSAGTTSGVVGLGGWGGGRATGSDGGGGAGFGGAIFSYTGTLILTGGGFSINTATGGFDTIAPPGTGTGSIPGVGKGGALFLYAGVLASVGSDVTFSRNNATDAGTQGGGNPTPPYTTHGPCPFRDDVDICGQIVGNSLTVTVVGNGTVAGGGFIDCPDTCVQYARGGVDSNTLTAHPTAGNAFTGWSGGGCSGAGTCAVSFATQRQSVTATFMPIAVASVTPNSGQQGSTNLLVNVVGTLTNFNPTTTVSFGAGITVTQVTASNATHLTARITIASDAAAGNRDVVVTTGTEVVGLTNGFTVLGPVLLSVTPNTGQQGATNLPVALVGSLTHFVQGTSTANFGSGITVNSLTVTDATHALANITISSTAGGGGSGGAGTNKPMAVTVTTGTEVVSLVGFTVLPGTPILTSVTPNSSSQNATNVAIALVGKFTSFTQGTSIASFGTGITVNSLTVTDTTHATATITIAPNAPTGAHDVTITTGTEVVSLPSSFTVSGLVSITPNTGQQGATNLPVALVGTFTHFVQGTSTANFGTGITVNSLTVTDATHALANITISTTAGGGGSGGAGTNKPMAVTVTTGTEVVSFVGFTVLPGTPLLSSVTPNSSSQNATNVSVALVGTFTNFTQGTSIASFGTGITVNSLTVTDTTHATATITIAPNAPTGLHDVTLTTGTEVVTLPSSFTVSGLLSVTPNTGQQGATNLPVALVGIFTHFVQGVSTANFGSGITVNSLTVTDATHALANITISSTAGGGGSGGAGTNKPMAVTVTTGTEVVSFVGFTVLPGTPILSSVTPNSSSQNATNVSVALVGTFTSFTQGTSIASFGTGITVNSLIVTDTTHATATITIAPDAPTGLHDVTVTTGTEVVTLSNAFTVVGLLSITPNTGQQGATNLPVALVGAFTHFVQGVSTVSFAAAGITVNSVTVTDATHATASITISTTAGGSAGSGAGAGKVMAVRVTTGTEVVSLAGFLITPGTPVLLSVTPNSGQQGATSPSVALVGNFTNFVQGTSTASFGAGITVNSLTVTDATHAFASITIAANAAAGNRDATVTTGGEMATLAGGFTVTSALGPMVTANPTNVTVNAGATASFTASASGSPTPTVQWQVSTDGVNFADIANATSLTYSFTTQIADNGKLFRAKFNNVAGTAFSTAAALAVYFAPAITQNPTNVSVTPGQTASFTASASGNPTPTVQWQVSTDGVNFSDIANATSATYSFTAQTSDNGKSFRAVFTNLVNSATTTAAALSAGTSSFIGTDNATQGAWNNKYGADGYAIANGAIKLPSYATVTIGKGTVFPPAASASAFTWAGLSSDPRALVNGVNVSNRIASTYTAADYSNNFQVRINTTDNNRHQIALYLLDWDTTIRTETIMLTDSSNAVLDTQSLSSFSNGKYAVWSFQGNLTITITGNTGSPVLSGLFFDPVGGGNTPQPSFTLNATSANATAGGTGSSTVSVIPANGFNAAVTLSAVAWPGGITGTFVTNPTTTTSLVNISVAANVAAGQYSLGVNGASGSISSTVNIPLSVSAVTPPALALSASAVTIAAGASGTTTLTETPTPPSGQFDLTLDTSAWPAGITAGTRNNFSQTINVAANVTPGFYSLPVTGTKGQLSAGTTIALTVTGPANTTAAASYTGLDSTTQGAWTGKFGADGFVIANGVSSLPAYASVNTAGVSAYTWAAQTTDVRALQTNRGAATGIASSYYGNTFSIPVNLSDGNTHQMSLYLLDFDTTARTETIAVLDAATNTVLDQQSFTGFHNGQYASWNVKGNIIFKVTSTGGANAVVSGLFFGASTGAPPPPTPSFTLTATPASATLGSTGTSTILVVPANGFNSAVTLATSNWPAGITGVFVPNPAPNTSTLTITVGANVTPGPYTLTVNGTSGALSATTTIALDVTTGTSTNSSASFAGIDTATQGAWIGKYGGKGYFIANGASSAPTPVVAAVNNALTYTWAGQTTDLRALQNPSAPAFGLASAYTQYPNNTFNVSISTSDFVNHSVSLYLLDWDTTSRSQTITVYDAVTNAVLDTETFTGFHNGQYVSWNIKGSVMIRVTPSAGTSPVVSGIFFN